jgi:hypothetical protein
MENAQPPAIITEQSPQKTTQQHPGHLPVNQPGAGGDELVAVIAKTHQAAGADDGEEDEVVDVDEIAEGSHQDGGMNQSPGDFRQSRTSGGRTFTTVGHRTVIMNHTSRFPARFQKRGEAAFA